MCLALIPLGMLADFRGDGARSSRTGAADLGEHWLCGATNIWALLGWRFLQGVAASSCMVMLGLSLPFRKFHPSHS